MNRRGLLQGILAAGLAPAIGHAGILMPVRKIIEPGHWGDMIIVRHFVRGPDGAVDYTDVSVPWRGPAPHELGTPAQVKDITRRVLAEYARAPQRAGPYYLVYRPASYPTNDKQV